MCFEILSKNSFKGLDIPLETPASRLYGNGIILVDD